MSIPDEILRPLKSRAWGHIEEHGDEIIALSLAIHEARELGLQEYKSSRYLADFLMRHGLSG